MSALSKFADKYLPQIRENIALACNDLFTNPSDTESDVLARLGRISFALQLTLNTPSSIYTHEILLPQTLYLDSNILMRTIVEGHPLQPLYVDTLKRLHDANKEASIDVPVLALPGFLDEVIAHRELAIREVEQLELEDTNELHQHIAYYGAERANIFIAAYSTWVGRAEKSITFREFLNSAAPYNDPKTLKIYLEKKGIEVHKIPRIEEFGDIYKDTYIALRDAYDNDPRSKFNPKEPVLINNEATQLAQLQYDRNAGIRSLFISGDMRLQACCTGPILSHPRASIISGRQFNQLVDLLLGLQTDSMSTARLLWGVTHIDEHQHVLNYLTDMALKEFDRNQAKTLPQVLPSLVPEIITAAKEKGISLFPGGTLESKSIRAKFLDRFEEKFYERMAEAIKELGLEN
jgi:hypothetical protein